MTKGLALLFGIPLLFVACQRGPTQSASENKTAVGEASTARTYVATGVIERLDSDSLVVVIRHEKIEGLMDAMTMPFHAERSELLKDLRVGDKVRFTLQHTRPELVLTAIEKTP